MATRRNPTQRGSARPQAGDATGRQVKAQQAAAAPALREAATKTTLIRPPEPEISDEIIDATGEVVEGVREISEDELEAMLDADTDSEYGDDTISDEDVDPESLPDGKTDLLGLDEEDLRELDEPQPKAKPFSTKRRTEIVNGEVQPREVTETPQVVQKKYKMMRVVEDIEDVTIGKDNHFTFRYGPRYRVTEHVYNHLDEKGLVLH
jgi:hypothetical protein